MLVDVCVGSSWDVHVYQRCIQKIWLGVRGGGGGDQNVIFQKFSGCI